VKRSAESMTMLITARLNRSVRIASHVTRILGSLRKEPRILVECESVGACHIALFAWYAVFSTVEVEI